MHQTVYEQIVGGQWDWTETIYHLDRLKHHKLFHNIDPHRSKDVLRLVQYTKQSLYHWK